jgi:hypothetical protein
MEAKRIVIVAAVWCCIPTFSPAKQALSSPSCDVVGGPAGPVFATIYNEDSSGAQGAKLRGEEGLAPGQRWPIHPTNGRDRIRYQYRVRQSDPLSPSTGGNCGGNFKEVMVP